MQFLQCIKARCNFGLNGICYTLYYKLVLVKLFCSNLHFLAIKCIFYYAKQQACRHETQMLHNKTTEQIKRPSQRAFKHML